MEKHNEINDEDLSVEDQLILTRQSMEKLRKSNRTGKVIMGLLGILIIATISVGYLSWHNENQEDAQEQETVDTNFINGCESQNEVRLGIRTTIHSIEVMRDALVASAGPNPDAEQQQAINRFLGTVNPSLEDANSNSQARDCHAELEERIRNRQ